MGYQDETESSSSNSPLPPSSSLTLPPSSRPRSSQLYSPASSLPHSSERSPPSERSPSSESSSLVREALHYLAPHLRTLHTSDLSKLFWSLARLGYRESAEDAGAPAGGRDDAATTSSSSSSKHRQQLRWQPLRLSELCAACQPQLEAFSALDLSNTLWGISVMGDALRGRGGEQLVRGLVQAAKVGGEGEVVHQGFVCANMVWDPVEGRTNSVLLLIISPQSTAQAALL